MTRVDFHILPATGKIERDRYVCKLAAKAVRQGHRVFLHAPTAEAAARLDDLLWTFRDTAFLPHRRAGDPDEDGVRVVIGHDETAPDEHDVMINLDHPTPAFFSRFERVVEVVPHDPSERAAARERYRFYQERGYPLTKHDIDSDHD
jgi:DNA polymerase-3 subunit chi